MSIREINTREISTIRDTISTKMKPNTCPVQLFELTQPDPRVDAWLPLVAGKTPNQIVDAVYNQKTTLKRLELIRHDLTHNRTHTKINRLIAASVGMAISILKEAIE
ncbi:hypothetical protein K7R09_05475 [Serratia ureilytica]|uniref:Uncharacterized protein n=1 Tax=Serratia ureilytica TaxID=300181 RepID=A0ABU0VJ03_9GAMM|nr:hypothetical protein [Serratia ureilytica]MCU7061232.1 hypothetical protein [Serratia ureilytica]MDQ1807255.1 hypothetical protein [Serratia ureilytica]MDQ1836312.1 hypothetical protein [Serratia ureilytica]MDQ1860915.1 hypothetical protein [Serratia ureilytica]